MEPLTTTALSREGSSNLGRSDRATTWPQRLARSSLFTGLQRLTGGSLTIRDACGTGTFGDLSAALSADLTVTDPRFYTRVALGGDLGAAEAYRLGWWRCDDLTSLLRIFVRNIDLTRRMDRSLQSVAIGAAAKVHHWLSRNTRGGSRRNIYAHYDLGNDFFASFLDPTMTYSCGVFRRADSTLEEASVAKLDRICRKLNLRPTDHVLEIGTGWGSFAIHAARHYGCRVTTTTISPSQRELAVQRIAEAGCADRVEVIEQDYRDLTGRYDKLVSIEMIEAVGHRYLPVFFRTCARLLASDGQMLLQAIVMPDHRYREYRRGVDFIQHTVFPGSELPSLSAMLAASAGASDLQAVHLEDLTPDYARTLQEWRGRFFDNIEQIRALGHGPEFQRLWEYYLCYCEAGFAERYIGTVQMLLVRPGCRSAPVRPDLPSVEMTPVPIDTCS